MALFSLPFWAAGFSLGKCVFSSGLLLHPVFCRSLQADFESIFVFSDSAANPISHTPFTVAEFRGEPMQAICRMTASGKALLAGAGGTNAKRSIRRCQATSPTSLCTQQYQYTKCCCRIPAGPHSAGHYCGSGLNWAPSGGRYGGSWRPFAAASPTGAAAAGNAVCQASPRFAPTVHKWAASLCSDGE